MTSSADNRVRRPGAWRSYHLLALLPPLGMLGGLPFANRVYPLVLGLPFLVAWFVGWVIATAAIMALILWRDRVNGIALGAANEHTDDASGPKEPAAE